MTNDKTIAIIGSPDTVIGFTALGLKSFGVTSKDEVESTLAKLRSSDTAIIFITEQWAAEVPELLADMRKQSLPAVLTVPSQKGSTGAGLNDLRSVVEQAVGSDILFNEE